jgi:predicted PolB exonuclease-like 3'-5' exonuclease
MELFHFDIETAGNYKDFQTFEDNDERGASLFKSKYERSSWGEKYENVYEAYLDNAGIVSTYGRIVCISFGYLDNGQERISSFYGTDEKEIVEKFNNLLKKIELKDFNLAGFRINYFDIPWVLHKLHKYGIKPANIIYLYDKKPWDVRIVDIADDWKCKFAWAFSFDEVAYELGINSPKENMNGSEVHKYYWMGRLSDIKRYCEMDVDVCIEVSKKLYNL